MIIKKRSHILSPNAKKKRGKLCHLGFWKLCYLLDIKGRMADG
jgi:hypothetical protein